MLTHQQQLQRRPLLVTEYFSFDISYDTSVSLSNLRRATTVSNSRGATSVSNWRGDVLVCNSRADASSVSNSDSACPAPDQTRPKATKNVHGKSQPQQRLISSKTTKGKQQLKESANLKMLSAMTQANLKFVLGKPMLTVDALHKVGQPRVELHNYYMNNYKSGQDIMVSYKDRHFLVGDSFFLISFSNLYDLFNFDALDISLMRCFTL
jgi:hypothetical protein